MLGSLSEQVSVPPAGEVRCLFIFLSLISPSPQFSLGLLSQGFCENKLGVTE